MLRSAFSASFLIVAGTFGSFVASASCTLTSPPSIWTDFTRPNETISRVNPGYFTDFNAFRTCSSEIDIPELTLVALEVNTIPRAPGQLSPKSAEPVNIPEYLRAMRLPNERGNVALQLVCQIDIYARARIRFLPFCHS